MLCLQPVTSTPEVILGSDCFGITDGLTASFIFEICAHIYCDLLFFHVLLILNIEDFISLV